MIVFSLSGIYRVKHTITIGLIYIRYVPEILIPSWNKDKVNINLII